MKKLLMVFGFMILSTPAFAKVNATPTAYKADGEYLNVTADFDIDGEIVTETFPVFGTYTKEYVDQSIKNRALTVEQRLIFKEQASNAESVLASDVGKPIEVKP